MSVFAELPTQIVVPIDKITSETITEEKLRIRDHSVLTRAELGQIGRSMIEYLATRFPGGIDRREIIEIEDWIINPINRETLLVTLILGEKDNPYLR